MGIEGLWAVGFGSYLENASGVAVFKSGRVLGGDNAWYYAGVYQVDGKVVRAQVRIEHYDLDLETVTGHRPGERFDIDIVGDLQGDDRINAHGDVVGDTRQQIEIRMRRLADFS